MVQGSNLLDLIKRKNLSYFTPQDLAENAGELKECFTALNALADDGQLILTDKGKYVRPDTLGLTRCVLRGNPKGFAFALVPDGKDIFIPAKHLAGAMNGDVVLVRVRADSRGDSPEGEVVNIVRRGNEELVGTYTKGRGIGYFTPDDKRFSSEILIPKRKNFSARDADKVVARITRYPKAGDRESLPEGEITEIIGSYGDPWLDVLSIMRQHHITEEFPLAVKKEAEAAPFEVSERQRAGRKDFRNFTAITIDGEDARDFDDAVSLTAEEGKYRLGVHIADVAQYVRFGSALDREAFERGTSVYFPDRAVPMLPKQLSNGICSLNEGVDRLTLSVLMEVDARGDVTSCEIVEGVIRSARRMTYTSVAKILKGDETEAQKYPELVPMLRDMQALSLILQEKRAKRGSIDFDMPESKITLDENGRVIDVAPYPREDSNRLIEEFMILANETVAEYMRRLELPFVYRVHEKPSPEKAEDFKKFLQALGLTLKSRGELHARQLMELLDSLKDSPLFPVVNRVMLRSMQKAKYSPENLGHFGLSSKCYCHFTSPIRRYPDLMVHRIIKYMLSGRLDESLIKRLSSEVCEVAAHSSEREKLATEAERDVDELKKAEFMQDKIGQVYSGVISGVTNFGVFVELENTVEGLIKIDNLPQDAYNYMENTYSLVGAKRTFRMGDTVTVRVESVNLDSRRVDFVLKGEEHEDHRIEQKSRPRFLSGGHVRGGHSAGGKRDKVAAPRKGKPKGQLRDH